MALWVYLFSTSYTAYSIPFVFTPSITISFCGFILWLYYLLRHFNLFLQLSNIHLSLILHQWYVNQFQCQFITLLLFTTIIDTSTNFQYSVQYLYSKEQRLYYTLHRIYHYYHYLSSIHTLHCSIATLFYSFNNTSQLYSIFTTQDLSFK